MSFIRTIYIFTFTLLLMASCKEEPDTPFNAALVKSNNAPSESNVVAAILQDYLGLKNALVATQSKKAHESAVLMEGHLQLLKEALDTVSIQKLPEHFSLQMDSMELQLNRIIAHNDESCESQRIYFKYLSDNTFSFIKAYDITNLHLYRYFCPMAMNGKGAWWISASTKVKNPYFGSKMLTCGELVDTLQ